MKVLVLGSINMDLVIKTSVFPEKGETVLGEEFFTSYGGKGGNQATAIAKLGVKPSMIGSVGSDLYGQNSIAELKKNGVDTRHILINKNKTTGIAMIIIHNNDNRIILESGANHSLEVDEIEKSFVNVNDGIFLSQLETNLDAVEYGFKKAKEKNMYTVLNPAPFVKQDFDFYKLVDLIVLNETECELMTQIRIEDEDSIIKSCKYISDLGINDIIITLGSKGSYCYTQGVLSFVPSYKVTAVDTTCAGDSFIGAVLYKLTKNETLIEGVRFGTKVAAVTVTRYGAQQAIPTLEELEKLEKEGFFDESYN